ncbi:MAG: hypothetical protein COA42_17430, partial [Alteromonadaceae bacterium]
IFFLFFLCTKYENNFYFLVCGIAHNCFWNIFIERLIRYQRDCTSLKKSRLKRRDVFRALAQTINSESKQNTGIINLN